MIQWYLKIIHVRARFWAKDADFNQTSLYFVALAQYADVSQLIDNCSMFQYRYIF